jgi:16S rRNA G1207 methylase RsmC
MEIYIVISEADSGQREIEMVTDCNFRAIECAREWLAHHKINYVEIEQWENEQKIDHWGYREKINI